MVVLVTLLASICFSPASADSVAGCQQSLTTPTLVTSVHVQPDDGPQPILDEINFAACSIDLSMYLFTNQDVFDALEHAVARGIRVRVILERDPFGSFGTQQEMFDRLKGIGAEVKWGPDHFTFSHSKYMVVDSSVLVVTNQNFTNAGFDRNREFGVVTTDTNYVLEAALVFEADWNRFQQAVDINHLIVSPVNSRATILDLINSSTDSVWMYSEVLRDEDVTTALSSAADRGVDVRILVNPTADEDDVPYFLDVFAHGVQVRVLNDPYVHSKAIIVDGDTALVGSQNYSFTSLNLNREVGLTLTDSVNLDRMVSVYERDWIHGEPVDTVTMAENQRYSSQIALTQLEPIGRIPFVYWRVV